MEDRKRKLDCIKGVRRKYENFGWRGWKEVGGLEEL